MSELIHLTRFILLGDNTYIRLVQMWVKTSRGKEVFHKSNNVLALSHQNF